MSSFLEQYGKAIFVLVLMAILIAFAGPLGIKIKNAVLTSADKLESIGNDEIENRNPKNYEAVDIEKSWTESHTDSYFFERVSSDKTNTDYNKWKSNNKEKHSTSAISIFTIKTTSEIEYSFDWTISSERNYDKLTITCNDTKVVNAVSGTKNGTEKITLKSGTNILKVTYSKDSSGSSGDDCATITLPKILIKNAGCKNKQTGEILDHIYNNGKITKEPTCIENGEKLFTCENCGKTKIEVINKLSTHNFVNNICTMCGLNLNDIPAVDEVYCIYYDDGEMTISQNEIEPEAGRTVIDKNFYEEPCSCTRQMKTVRFEGIVKPKSCWHWFYSCQKLKEIKNINNLCTNECVDMTSMFEYCTALTNLDVSHFDTSKVTNMSHIFSMCKNLINLDVSHFDTSNVTDMAYMFNGCKLLTQIDVSHFDTNKVTNMWYMFDSCTSLTTLDLSNFVIIPECKDYVYAMIPENVFKAKSIKISKAAYDIIKVRNCNIPEDVYIFVK